ncbi:MAG: class 1 isoprenoid biosynthesis enzyme [Bacteroidetes bacterium]|nr:class 1 isoprenoid biosynthesis enzyme [Bacteroidota bacterium]
MKIIQLITTLQQVLKYISLQKDFLTKNVQPVLQSAISQNDGSLDEADLKKITQYYGLAVPAILGEAFCRLHNKKMSDTERLAATAQGAMTGLFDDFFDKQYLSDEAIEDFLTPGNTSIKKSNEQLFDYFYKNALQHVPDKNRMRDALREVYHAQVESKKQTNASISTGEIEHITFYKGGASLLFYRSAFLPFPSTKEIKLVYHLGGLMQLSNDIFDVYKDRENGIKTLVTETKHIRELRSCFKTKLAAAGNEAWQCGLPRKNVQQFLSILSLGIFSRVMVCLDQLESNEKFTEHEFSVHQYSRKQLVCDMDTMRNKIRSAGYFDWGG